MVRVPRTSVITPRTHAGLGVSVTLQLRSWGDRSFQQKWFHAPPAARTAATQHQTRGELPAQAQAAHRDRGESQVDPCGGIEGIELAVDRDARRQRDQERNQREQRSGWASERCGWAEMRLSWTRHWPRCASDPCESPRSGTGPSDDPIFGSGGTIRRRRTRSYAARDVQPVNPLRCSQTPCMGPMDPCFARRNSAKGLTGPTYSFLGTVPGG